MPSKLAEFDIKLNRAVVNIWLWDLESVPLAPINVLKHVTCDLQNLYITTINLPVN
jgi:hypothetical protein